MNQETKEAIELVKKVKSDLWDYTSPNVNVKNEKLSEDIELLDQALAKLRIEQPPAGNLTKKVREDWDKNIFGGVIFDLCDRLDRSEAEIKKYVEMDKYKSKQIILGTENYNRICKTVEQLVATIKELEVELKELGELRIIFDDDSALRHVIKLREEIKESKKVITELKTENEHLENKVGDLRAEAVRRGLMTGGNFTGKP